MDSFNSEIFERVLFLRTFAITLLSTDVGKSCSKCEILTTQICLLSLLVKIKFSQKLLNLQYINLQYVYFASFQVIFTYTVGSGFRGDVAIDEFAVAHDLCTTNDHTTVYLPSKEGNSLF